MLLVQAGLLNSCRNAWIMNRQERKKQWEVSCPSSLSLSPFLPSCFGIFIRLWQLDSFQTQTLYFSGFSRLKTRWPLHWAQGKGKITRYQEFPLASTFPPCSSLMGCCTWALETAWASRKQISSPLLSPRSMLIPHPTPILLPGPCAQCPEKSERYNNPNLSSVLLWKNSCKTWCKKKLWVNLREN